MGDWDSLQRTCSVDWVWSLACEAQLQSMCTRKRKCDGNFSVQSYQSPPKILVSGPCKTHKWAVVPKKFGYRGFSNSALPRTGSLTWVQVWVPVGGLTSSDNAGSIALVSRLSVSQPNPPYNHPSVNCKQPGFFTTSCHVFSRITTTDRVDTGRDGGIVFQRQERVRETLRKQPSDCH